MIEFLEQAYMFDMWVYTRWWLWAPVGIPIILYTVWFIVKWFILTLPFWMPFALIAQSTRRKND